MAAHAWSLCSCSATTTATRAPKATEPPKSPAELRPGRNDTPHIKHPHPRPRARDDRRFHAYGCLFFQLVFVRCTKKQGIHGRFGERACLLFILQAKPFILGGPRLFSCSGDANGPICDATMVHQDGFRYQVPLSNRLINVVLV